MSAPIEPTPGGRRLGCLLFLVSAAAVIAAIYYAFQGITS